MKKESSVTVCDSCISAPKPVGRRTRKAGIDRKPRQAYSAKQLERLEAEFKVTKLLFQAFRNLMHSQTRKNMSYEVHRHIRGSNRVQIFYHIELHSLFIG